MTADNPNPHSVMIRSTALNIAQRFSLDAVDGQAAAAAIVNQLGIANASPQEILQMLVVCSEHGLNPFTKEIYAFKQGSKLQPLIGFDGWIRIANSNPNYDGHCFAFTDGEDGKPVSCRCTIYRKDRTHPVEVEEFYSENNMPSSPVWKQRPRRMLMIRALAQAVRQAFGVSGIHHDLTPEEAGEEIRRTEATVKHAESHNSMYQGLNGKTEVKADAVAVAEPPEEREPAMDEDPDWGGYGDA